MIFRKILPIFVSVILFLSACQETVTQQQDADKEISVIDNVTDLIQKDSNNALLYNQRAKLYLSDGKIELALNDVNKGLGINSKEQQLFLTLAEVYLKMGQSEGCNNALLKAVELNPQNPVPFFRLAELNLLLEDYSTAMIYADRSLNLSKVNPDALFTKGLIFLAQTDTVNAIRFFQFSLDQKETFLEPLIQLGIVYSVQRNPLAEQYLLKVIQLYPDAYSARYQLALYLQDNERANDAILHYDTLLQVVPDNKFVLFNLGFVHLVYLNNYEKAINYFDEVLINDPNYIDALYNKGRALEELGQYLNAREIYTEVLSRERNHQLSIEALNRLDRRR
jgi:tetratricopeptide (TPR) repeat protein